MNLKLENGAEPLMHFWRWSGEFGFVLAKWRGEFVVWRFWLNQDGVGICEHGDYFGDRENAVKRFTHRVKLSLED